MGKHLLDEVDDALQIHKIKVRSVWLGHGFWAAVGSAVTGPTTGSSITHWWVEIETRDPSTWYCAQFMAPNLVLTKHNTHEEVTNHGKHAAGRSGDINISDKVVFYPTNLTMKEVRDWMGTYNADYDLLKNNCQHFAEALSFKFSSQHAASVRGPVCAVM